MDKGAEDGGRPGNGGGVAARGDKGLKSLVEGTGLLTAVRPRARRWRLKL
jgi:hypothetical protein